MAKWALVVDGVVREVIVESPDRRYHRDLVFVQVPVGVNVDPGWLHDGTQFRRPPPPPPPEPDTRRTAPEVLDTDTFEQVIQILKTVVAALKERGIVK